MMFVSTTMLSLRSTSAAERIRSSASSRWRMSRASTCRIASAVPVTVAALMTSGMSIHAARKLFWRDSAVAEHLHVCLGVPAERVAVDDGGEAPDDAVVEHSVHPPLHRGSRQVHPLADLGVGGPGIVGQLGQNALVGLVQTVHDHLHATNHRNSTSDATNRSSIRNKRRLIAKSIRHIVYL